MKKNTAMKRLPAPFLLFVLLVLSLGACNVKKYSSDSRPVSHAQWDSLLRRHVTPDGWVDYRGFLRDSARLQTYLELLSAHHPNDEFWSREERLAYWINAYNAFTVRLVVDHYPVESIKNIKNGIPFVNTVWDIKFIDIEERAYALNNIEHGIIRERFDEPRIHFAVNCAAKSCPKLRNEAYTAEQLDRQLDEQARDFLNDPAKNRVEPDHLQLSRIFRWYGGDFKAKGSIIEFINPFTPVDIHPGAEIDFMEYDWSLNDVENDGQLRSMTVNDGQ